MLKKIKQFFRMLRECFVMSVSNILGSRMRSFLTILGIIIGVMAMLFFHVYENIGMCIGLMPITGIPLPFISYGGTNLVVNMAGIGLVLNVTANKPKIESYEKQPS